MGARKFDDRVRNDRKFLGRPEAPEDIQVASAEGSRVRDARGRTFIDLTMGWCVGNLGWNPPEIVQRVHAFRGPSYVHPSYVYPRWADLAQLLVEEAPGKLARAYRATTGTEAVELALQLAMEATGRSELVSLEGAYHGNSIAAKSIGEGGMLRGVHHLAPPLDDRALTRLDRTLKTKKIAAVILEPIVMNLGVLVPDAAFMRELVPLCHHHGTLVIADEVACGFGRTGKMFASEHFDLEPDLMCLAKALTSGVAPLAATLATADVAKRAAELEFYATFGWHPLAVEAAIATLRYWQVHGDALLDNIEARGNDIRKLALPAEAELRVAGLAVAIDLGDEDRVERVAERCRKAGLLVSADDENVCLFPALTIDEDTLAEGLAILERALSA